MHSQQENKTLSTIFMSPSPPTHKDKLVTSVTNTTNVTMVIAKLSQWLMLWSIAWMVSNLFYCLLRLLLWRTTGSSPFRPGVDRLGVHRKGSPKTRQETRGLHRVWRDCWIPVWYSVVLYGGQGPHGREASRGGDCSQCGRHKENSLGTIRLFWGSYIHLRLFVHI